MEETVSETRGVFAHDNQVPHNVRPCSEYASSQADLDIRFLAKPCGVPFLSFSHADLVFYVSFNIVLVISIRGGDNERYSEASYSRELHATFNEVL